MNLKDCHNFSDFRKLAKKNLPSPIFHYIEVVSDQFLYPYTGLFFLPVSEQLRDFPFLGLDQIRFLRVENSQALLGHFEVRLELRDAVALEAQGAEEAHFCCGCFANQ